MTATLVRAVRESPRPLILANPQKKTATVVRAVRYSPRNEHGPNPKEKI